jgi:CheY-like chemotaxis protein
MLDLKERMKDLAVVLLAEDDEDDVYLIRRAYKAARLRNPLVVVRSGDEVIAYLKGEGPFADRLEYPLPALLLLDLKMPGTDGYEVLKWIRQEPGLRKLRVIVLTGSVSMHDLNLAYQAGANSFLVKPGNFVQFVEILRTLGDFWLGMAEAPEINSPTVKAKGETTEAPTGVASTRRVTVK